MRARITEELAQLQKQFPAIEHKELDGEDWFRLPDYPVPEGWQIAADPVDKAPVVFVAKADYPGAPPYGFLAPAGLNFRGTVPANTGGPPKLPPFSGNWLHFSWTVENWKAGAEPSKGSNLLQWLKSFAERFREGA